MIRVNVQHWKAQANGSLLTPPPSLSLFLSLSLSLARALSFSALRQAVSVRKASKRAAAAAAMAGGGDGDESDEAMGADEAVYELGNSAEAVYDTANAVGVEERTRGECVYARACFRVLARMHL